MFFAGVPAPVIDRDEPAARAQLDPGAPLLAAGRDGQRAWWGAVENGRLRRWLRRSGADGALCWRVCLGSVDLDQPDTHRRVGDVVCGRGGVLQGVLDLLGLLTVEQQHRAGRHDEHDEGHR